MNRIRNTLCMLAFAVVMLAAGPGAAQTQWFSANLSGANTVGSPGDIDGWGLGVIGVGSDTISYYLWVTDIDEPTAAHIHAGSAAR